jgi:hypothetical protein
LAWGVIVLLFGAWAFMAGLYPEMLPGPVFSRDWPLFIVAAGLVTITVGIVRVVRSAGSDRIWWGVLVALVGGWIWMSRLAVDASFAPGLSELPEWLRFQRSWPVLIVVLGAWIIFRSVRGWARRRVRKVDVLSDLESGRIDVDQAVERLRRTQ